LFERGSNLIRLVAEHDRRLFDAARRQAAQHANEQWYRLHAAQRLGATVITIPEPRAKPRGDYHCTFDRVIHMNKVL
jgi:hypothetical protein